jgi:molecular chaperone GrpE
MKEEKDKKKELNEKLEKLEKLKKKHEEKIEQEEMKEDIDKQEEFIKNLSNSFNDLQNKYLYQQAEFQNYKKRREEETISLLKYKNEDIAEDLLPLLDSFDRAFVNKDKMSEELLKYLSGFELIYNNLLNVFNKYEIKEIDCLNKEFDHNTCQALMTEHKEGIEPGIVIEVLQKGYMIKDKLLRAALVKVSE